MITIDEQAVAAFVAEIADSVQNTALACIHDRNGQPLWHQAYQSGAPPLEDCTPPTDPVSAEPVKRSLGNGDFAFDFPLQCANVDQCVFTIVVYTLDPPSLTAVKFQIGEMLTCIGRQIDLDVTLSTTTISSKDIPARHNRDSHLIESSSADSAPSLLQKLVSQCYKECNAECVAVVIPTSEELVIESDDDFDRSSIRNLAVQLQKPLELKRRIVTARITLTDGKERQAVCAPIQRKQQSMDGMVLLVAKEVEPSHSKLIRLVAGKIAKLRDSEPLQTKLLTRFELIPQVTDVLSRQSTLPHSLIYFDADKMHTINDAFGYSGGDRALNMFRRILLDSAGANDVVAHLGSDRFALFMPGASGETALAKATQILQFFAQESIDDGAKSIGLSASAGVVDTAAATKGAEDMLVLSEVAARGAQDRGGNQCALFQDIDSSIIQRRSDVDKVGFLQMALIENRFVLHAQLIEPVNADSGRKYELLARLDEGDNSDSSPAQFLSAAERYQLMAALDRWVINSALTSISNAESTLEVSLSIFCINVSAQSIQDDTFVDYIEARIAESGVAPDTLCFEITETSLVRHINRAQKFVHRLQRLGCLVALDDFGTGYSSFAYLKTLPVNFLKIDGSFVRDILENDLSKTIVRAVVSIADVIGAQTVAEHVENPMVHAWLKQAGVHFVQGFVVHRPEPFEDILKGMDGLSVLFEEDSRRIDLRSSPEPVQIAAARVRHLDL